MSSSSAICPRHSASTQTKRCPSDRWIALECSGYSPGPSLPNGTALAQLEAGPTSLDDPFGCIWT